MHAVPEEAQKFAVFSDTHFGFPHANRDWQRNCAFALMHLPNEYTDVILLGDTFDTWCDPPNVRATTVMTLCTTNLSPEAALFVAAVRALLSRGVKVTFVRGNHDDDASELFVKSVFGSQMKYVDVSFRWRDVYFTHGQQEFDVINMHVTEVPGFRPFGYYVARCFFAGAPVLETREVVAGCLGIWQKLLFALGIWDEVEIINYIVPRLFLPFRKSPRVPVEFFMPDGKVVTDVEVSSAFLHICESRMARLSRQDYIERFRCGVIGEFEIGVYDNLIERFCVRNGYRAVVFGHTHLADLRVLPRTDTIIANSGAWSQIFAGKCKNAPTYLDVRLNGDGNTEITLLQMTVGGSEDQAPQFSVIERKTALKNAPRSFAVAPPRRHLRRVVTVAAAICCAASAIVAFFRMRRLLR